VVSSSYGASVTAGSVQKPTEVFDITVVRVNGAPDNASATATTTASLAGGGDTTAPAVFVVNVVGYLGPAPSPLAPVFDSFQAVAVCLTPTSCTVSPTV
jgi:hypothetical protein